MPYNDITVTNEETGQTMTLPELEQWLDKKIKEQAATLLQDADGKKFTPGNEFQKMYLDKKEIIINYVKENIAAAMSVDLLNEMIEKSYIDVETSQFKNIHDARAMGGWYGEFIEAKLFGLEKSTNPMADLLAISTEIKVHSGKKDILSVGGVTVYNFSETETIGDKAAIKKLISLYKMVIKMQNFLFFKIEPVMGNGVIHMGFKEITLHMVLILQKLYDMIYGKMYDNVVWSDSGEWNKKELKKAFTVKISIVKINDIYKFAKLYLYHLDLLNDIKTNAGERANFWKLMKEMKLAFISGKTEFGFDVIS
jgi:hypothetical protein